MEDSFFEIEHRPGDAIVLRFRSPQLWGLPDSTRRHMRSASKEMLLAVRGVLDKAIEKMEEPAPKRKRTKIEVQ